jgi:hypothetical protein
MSSGRYTSLRLLIFCFVVLVGFSNRIAAQATPAAVPSPGADASVAAQGAPSPAEAQAGQPAAPGAQGPAPDAAAAPPVIEAGEAIAPPPAAPAEPDKEVAAPPAPPAADAPQAPAASQANAQAEATKKTVDATASAKPPVTDSLLANAGYPLTPGVSSEPIRSDFVLSGYLQAQYEAHQDSMDQLRQGGTLLNQNRFLLRRGRIKVTRDWDYAQVILEIDGNTTRGPTMRVQKAEASLIYGRSKDRDQPPIAQLTLGQFDLPFGFEVPYVPKVRWFMERTTGSRALFPSEPDVGLRFSGGFAFARYSIAISNGEPLDEKSPFALQDPNANKDVTARFGAEQKLGTSFVIAGGVSFNRGKGLSTAGSDATKNVLNWVDTNENGKVDPIELVGTGGTTAMRSKDFGRWAVGGDLELLFKSDLGWAMFYGEIVAASNLDRGLVVADPVFNNATMRELTYYVAFTQEITQYGVVGFRYEFYDPNADATDTRVGKVLPSSQQITTYSPLVGLVLPGRARLMFEWDIVRDYLARDRSGVPTDFKNNQWTVRLQGVL